MDFQKYLLKSIPALALLLILQGCASTGGSQETNTGLYSADNTAAAGKLADKVGEAQIGEVITASAAADGSVREYTVLEQYTAASGRTCRNVSVLNLNTQRSSTALYCLDEDDGWFRVRDILLK
ncbi:hypothetical protein Q4485_09760 [Granulosicoccaceae sp. 1_MG-2023]|nr:hypothetical protein [Granulosicoccaceae sp. 1_MG-2023]